MNDQQTSGERPKSKFRYSNTIYPQRARTRHPSLPDLGPELGNPLSKQELEQSLGLLRPSRIPPAPMPTLPEGALLPPKSERPARAAEPVRTRRPELEVRRIDRLWNAIGEEANCTWLDRDLRYVTWWMPLSVSFGTDIDRAYRPYEEQHFQLFVLEGRNKIGIVLDANQHSPVICFAHKQVFYLRSNLPDKLLELLERRQQDPSVRFRLCIKRGRKSSTDERVLTIVKASPPSVF